MRNELSYICLSFVQIISFFLIFFTWTYIYIYILELWVKSQRTTIHLFWNVAVTYIYIQLQYNNLTPYNYATLIFGHSVTMRTHTLVQNLLGDQLNMITSKVYYSFEASVVSFCQLLIFRLFNWNIINSLYIDNDPIY